MIKECPVLLNNEAVTVVKYGDAEIQFPSIKKDAKKVNVKFDNGKYSIVDDAAKAEPEIKPADEEPVKAKTKKKAIKAESEELGE